MFKELNMKFVCALAAGSAASCS